MNFVTKPNLSRQSIIKAGETAEYDGSIKVNENFFISTVQIDPNSALSEYVLAYDSLLNKFRPVPPATGDFGNRIISGMRISGDSIDALKFIVSDGYYRINRDIFHYTGDTFTINSGDPTYNRYDLIYLTGGTIQTQINQTIILEGTPSSTPLIPTNPDPDNSVTLCVIDVNSGLISSGLTPTIIVDYLINIYDIQYSKGVYNNLGSYLDGNYVYPKIDSLINNIDIAQYGQLITGVTFNWSVNKLGYNYILNPTGGTYNNQINTYQFINQNITGDTGNTSTSFILTFDDGIQSTIKSTTINFYNKRYYGSTTLTGLTSFDIINLQYNEFATDKSFTLKSLSGNNEYIYFCQPVRLNEVDIFVNNFYTNDFEINNINFTNEFGYTEPYYVIRTTNLITSDKIFFLGS